MLGVPVAVAFPPDPALRPPGGVGSPAPSRPELARSLCLCCSEERLPGLGCCPAILSHDGAGGPREKLGVGYCGVSCLS